MKTTALVFVCLVAAVTAYGNPLELPDSQRVTYSETSKAKIQAAADKMIETLCVGNDVETDIMYMICMPVLNAKIGQKTYSSASKLRNCPHCDVADPICWEACPQ